MGNSALLAEMNSTANTRTIHPGNFAAFVDVYSEELTKAHAANPVLYAFPASQLPAVITRMTAAIERGSFNHDSPTFKATAKRLGIKPTRTAIETFICL